MSKIKLIKNNDLPQGGRWLQKAGNYLGIALDWIISIYMLLIIVVMPFYFENENGYRIIGTNKYDFLKAATMNAGIILLPLTVIYLLFYVLAPRNEKRAGIRLTFTAFCKSFSITDISAALFGVSVLLSYLFTDYREEALWGAKGWYMGLATQLSFIGMYFYISRVWKKKNWIPALFLPVSAIVFLLGYLNRFGIYPISMEYANPSFVSTIGNINWYCGYLVTVFFGGVFYLWYGDFKKPWLKIPALFYVGIGFASLVTQGSSSGIMTLLAVLLVLFLLSVSDGKRLRSYLEIIFTLALVCLITFIVRIIFPDAITYIETATDLFTYSFLPFLIAAVSGGLLLWVRRIVGNNRYRSDLFRILGKIVLSAVILCAVSYVILLIVNTLRPNSIGLLSDISLFTFSSSWGSNRGVTWKAGMMCFMEQGFLKKLVGVGPDCMAAYILTDGSAELTAMVTASFGEDRLTNAHNEWLTMLVNLGLLGMFSYVTMIVSGIIRFIKKGIDKNHKSADNLIAGACGFGILAYTINNMVSFQQSMNGAAMFMILGIGGAYVREREME